MGRAVQVDPIEPALKAPGSKRLKLKCDHLRSSFAFKFNLRRYIWAELDIKKLFEFTEDFKGRLKNMKGLELNPVFALVEEKIVAFKHSLPLIESLKSVRPSIIQWMYPKP